MVRRDLEERNRLVALVKLQAREIDALKVEISLLRRKGGHIYVPSLSNTGPSESDAAPSVLGIHPCFHGAYEDTSIVGVTPGLGHM